MNNSVYEERNEKSVFEVSEKSGKKSNFSARRKKEKRKVIMDFSSDPWSKLQVYSMIPLNSF